MTIVVFFPVFINTFRGLTQIDPVHDGADALVRRQRLGGPAQGPGPGGPAVLLHRPQAGCRRCASSPPSSPSTSAASRTGSAAASRPRPRSTAYGRAWAYVAAAVRPRPRLLPRRDDPRTDRHAVAGPPANLTTAHTTATTTTRREEQHEEATEHSASSRPRCGRPRASSPWAAAATTTAGATRPQRRTPRHRRPVGGTGRVRCAESESSVTTGDAEADQVAAPVGDPGPVRGLLRRRRPGLLQGRRSRRRDPRGRGRHHAPDRAGPGQRRLRHRLGAQGARSRASRAPASRTSPRSSSARARCRCRARPTTSPTRPDLEGKKVGNWGFGNEFELFAGMTQAGLDPASDVTLVQQDFDMQALLSGDIDAAQAMTYNEYAQVLEAVNPETGELYTPGGLDGHQLERRRHGDAAGRHLGRHREAGLRSGVQGDGHGVRQGVAPGLDLLP